METAGLRPWLLSALEPICEADPTVLSDYILALLKHDSTREELRQLCLAQLEDFLDHQTAAFVDQLFAFLDAPPSPALTQPTDDSRKRKLDRSPSPSLAPAKLARSAAFPSPTAVHHSLPTAPAAMRRDQGPSHPREHQPPPWPVQQAPQWPFGAGPDAQARPGDLCKDYHFRGFCARGDGCPFLHDAPTPPQRSQPPGSSHPPTWRASGPSSIAFPQPFPLAPAAFPFAPFPAHANAPPPFRPGPPPSSHRHPLNHPSRPPRPFGAQAAQRTPNVDARQQSQTTLVVENAPREALTVQSVRAFFDKFGSVTEVAIDVPALRAVVTFANPDHARAALGSPDAIFGNRFVRVFRQRIGDIVSPPLPHPPPQSRIQSAHSSPASSSTPQPASTTTHRVVDSQRAERAARASRLLENAAEQKELMRTLDATPAPDAKARSAVMAALRKLATEATDLSVANTYVAPAKVDASRVREQQAQLDKLRQERFGQVLSVTPVGNALDQVVEFKDRGSAEEALGQGSVIAGVGQIKLEWFTAAIPAPVASPDPAVVPVPPPRPHDVEMAYVPRPVPVEPEPGSVEGPLESRLGEDDERERSWNR